MLICFFIYYKRGNMASSIPSNAMHANLQTLQGISTNGLLSAARLKEMGVNATTSYDETVNSQVSYNCITKMQGISVSLFNQAKGALPVVLERRDDPLFKSTCDAHGEDIKRTFEAKMKDLPSSMQIYASQLETQAKAEVIAKDSSFTQTLAARAHRSVLFVFENSQTPTLPPMDGCLEMKESQIPPDRIKYVLLSKEEFGTHAEHLPFPKDKVIFLEDITTDQVTYVPKPGENVKIPALSIPDYAQGLKEVLQRENIKEGELASKPLKTHMVRLKTDEEFKS